MRERIRCQPRPTDRCARNNFRRARRSTELGANRQMRDGQLLLFILEAMNIPVEDAGPGDQQKDGVRLEFAHDKKTGAAMPLAMPTVRTKAPHPSCFARPKASCFSMAYPARRPLSDLSPYLSALGNFSANSAAFARPPTLRAKTPNVAKTPRNVRSKTASSSEKRGEHALGGT